MIRIGYASVVWRKYMLNDYNTILRWQGWTVINSISQIIIAIFVTLSQIGNRRKIKLDIEIEKVELDKKNIFFNLYLYNFGIAPIFIRNCWIGFKRKKSRDDKSVFELKVKRDFIKPGEGKLFKSKPINRAKWECRLYPSSKVFIFIQNTRGKIKRVKLKKSIFNQWSQFKNFSELILNIDYPGEEELDFLVEQKKVLNEFHNK